jgi:hypothetical protein
MTDAMKDYDPFDPNDKNIVRLSTWMASRRSGVPQSTIDAFWFLVQVGDEARLKAWLEDRREWAPQLRNLWKARKNGTA